MGGANDLRRLLTHIRLSGRLADIIYSMETTNTDFYAYQFKPVVKMLDSSGKGILIADEVGLGKTIEAGLIWTELKTRFDLQRLLVLCPAMLRKDKWQVELLSKFGINADICDAESLVGELEHVVENPAGTRFALIGSMQGLRAKKEWKVDQETENDKSSTSRLSSFLHEHKHDEPLIDLLIIDEAHYLRNPETKTAELGRLLRDVAEHVVLLSATPIHLRNNDLFQLLNIVDEDTFSRPDIFEMLLAANAPLVKARDLLLSSHSSQAEFKEALAEARASDLLRNNRQLQSLIEKPLSDLDYQDRGVRSDLAYRLETLNLLSNSITRTRKREITEGRVIREPYVKTVTMNEVEKEFYDKITGIVRSYCDRYAFHEGFLLVIPQRQMCSSMPAAIREWKRREEEYQRLMGEDFGVDDDEEIKQPGPIIQEILDHIDDLGDYEVFKKNDSKYDKLQAALIDFFKKEPHSKVIIFSYFLATLDYLHERLCEEKIDSIVLKGGMDEPKGNIIEKFRSVDGPQVLLSSEVGSEGIDLQFSHVVINYDLPWNPMKVEQRIGRVDRIGQKSPKVNIWNFFYDDTIDARIYERLYKRLKLFEYALGGLEPILGTEIPRLTYDLLSSRLTPEQEIERIEQTAQAVVNLQNEQDRLERDAAYLVAYGDYITNQVKAALELNRRIIGMDIYHYVSGYLARYFIGCEISRKDNTELIYDIKLSNEAKNELDSFMRSRQIKIPTRLIQSDSRPVRCVFENKVGDTRGGCEIINHSHPIVRFVNHGVHSKRSELFPVVAIKMDKSDDDVSFKQTLFAFTVYRWSISGLQEIEKLFYFAIEIGHPIRILSHDEAEKLVTTAANKGSDWIVAADPVNIEYVSEQISALCMQNSEKAFKDYIAQIEIQNADRADIQENTLENHLNTQLSKLEAVKQTHLKFGRKNLVEATKGKMEKLKNRIDMKKLQIAEHRKIRFRSELVNLGIIKIEHE